VVSVKPGYLAPWLVAAGASAAIAGAPIAAADTVWPVAGAESASDTIEDLQAEGFSVSINWLNGSPSVPLSECWVTGIHNTDGATAKPHALSIVYVDIECPNNEND
jgi:hypothetical protein